MDIVKATYIAKFGPRTETRRVQAIEELRRWAQEVVHHAAPERQPETTNMAEEALMHARNLEALGDLNLRS